MSFVDAPMSGGVSRAREGTLSFMVGASEEDYARVTPLLSSMGTKLFHCGGVGTGGVAALSNNCVMGAQMISLAEGLALGKELGADPKVLS